jgi:hypothetical protein
MSSKCIRHTQLLKTLTDLSAKNANEDIGAPTLQATSPERFQRLGYVEGFEIKADLTPQASRLIRLIPPPPTKLSVIPVVL